MEENKQFKANSTSSAANSKLHRGKRKRSSFGQYFAKLDQIDTDLKGSQEFGSFLILNLVEEIGEMARAYLAKHGRKPTNIAAQQDETYEQELGDIMVAIIRFARIKNIDLHHRVMASLNKIKRRKEHPKL
ncbi:MAG: MazG nucleotide pyrophosphohydrolase domain-containing protein [Microgenomates group bacterium]